MVLRNHFTKFREQRSREFEAVGGYLHPSLDAQVYSVGVRVCARGHLVRYNKIDLWPRELFDDVLSQTMHHIQKVTSVK